MKVTYHTPDKKLVVEFDAAGIKESFEQIAMIQEVFEQEYCGHCKKSSKFKYVVRKVDDNKYYEVECRTCHYKLGYGQMKKGGELFPRRFNVKTKQPIGENGWFKWGEQPDVGDDD